MHDKNFDRNDLALSYYEAIYRDYKNRKFVQEGKGYVLKYSSDKEIEVSGDCIFNFGKIHVDYFENILKKAKNTNKLSKGKRKKIEEIEKRLSDYSKKWIAH